MSIVLWGVHGDLANLSKWQVLVIMTEIRIPHNLNSNFALRCSLGYCRNDRKYGGEQRRPAK